MSQRFTRWEKIFISMTGIMIILACSVFVPKSTDIPTSEPSTHTQVVAPTTPPMIPIRPISPPTKARPPLPKPVQPSKVPAGIEPDKGVITNACLMVQMNEVAALFPNPPAPSNEFKTQDEGSTSTCSIIDGKTYLTLAVMTNPEYIRFNSIIDKIKVTDGFTQFSVSEANIYQTRWPTQDFKSGNALAAIIMKGNLAVEISGASDSYQYDSTRESQFLTKIAKRLPFIPSARNACALITVNEMLGLFPNLTAPNQDVMQYETYAEYICRYVNDDMDFSISIATNPELARQYAANLEQVISAGTPVAHFPASGADIYQGVVRDDEHKLDFFAAIILKGDIVIRLGGRGTAYEYNAEREARLLEAVAGRLP